MRYIPLFLLLALFITGCSQRVVEEPAPVERVVPGIISESVMKKAQKKYGKHVRERFQAYNSKLYSLQNTPNKVKLEEINNFYNKIPYVDDIKIWGKRDYWATPLEFLARGKGDCEDYVIAKYFSLRNLGVESKKLYFSYVRSNKFTRAHMVLSYFETPYSVPLILDSINYRIFPADKRTDLTPVYNFNGETLYRARQKWQNGAKVTNKTSNQKVHNKWDRLIEDIKRNKL